MKGTHWLVALCVVAFGVIVLLPGSPEPHALAADLISSCAGVEAKDKCYEQTIPAFYPEYSVAEIFSVIRAVREQDKKYQFCHVLAHKVGERVVAEDPSGWVDAMAQNPSDGLCSNGFIHGVVGGRFRAEVLDDSTIDSLVADFTRACEPRPKWVASELDRAICYHGMGHLYDFITDADLEKALELCARTTPEIYSRVCVEGVFMQIYQPLEPDDYALIERLPVKLTQESVRPFCTTFGDPKFVGACLRESWPLWSEEIRNGTAVPVFCSGQPNSEQERFCYESVSALIGRTSLADPTKSFNACAHFPEQFKSTCLFASALAILEEQRTDSARAVAYCAETGTFEEGCLAHLASRAHYVFGPNTFEHKKFCEHMPVTLRTQCGA